jgi:hypothetical protein
LRRKLVVIVVEQVRGRFVIRNRDNSRTEILIKGLVYSLYKEVLDLVVGEIYCHFNNVDGVEALWLGELIWKLTRSRKIK